MANKFKPGDKLICLQNVNYFDGSDNIPVIVINQIYTCKAATINKAYKTGYCIYIEENNEGWDSSFFESAEKLIFDKDFNNKLEDLIK